MSALKDSADLTTCVDSSRHHPACFLDPWICSRLIAAAIWRAMQVVDILDILANNSQRNVIDGSYWRVLLSGVSALPEAAESSLTHVADGEFVLQSRNAGTRRACSCQRFDSSKQRKHKHLLLQPSPFHVWGLEVTKSFIDVGPSQYRVSSRAGNLCCSYTWSIAHAVPCPEDAKKTVKVSRSS